MIEPNEAAEVLDWTLAAACLQATVLSPRQPCRGPDGCLEDALRAHLRYLRDAAPITHLAVCALLAIDAPASDNLRVLRLAGHVTAR